MPTEAKCRLFKRKDGKYLIYLPLALVEDSMFPFPMKNWEQDPEKETSSIHLKVSFRIGVNKLTIEPLEKEQ